ncbi:50S ribosomal protein L10 [Deinobacterium chartae]|nr:50S ribosomal protein L10 [Deinobacterium chartae]
MANQRNQDNLAALRTALEGVETFYVVNYQGLTAGQLTRLRKELVGKGGRLIVAKNTLVNIALKDADRDFSDILHGPTAVVVASEDPAGTAKVLADFAKTNDKGIPAAKGGLLEGKRIDVKTIEKLANLGSKEQLQAELVGVLSSHLSNFVGILEAYKDKLEAQSA